MSVLQTLITIIYTLRIKPLFIEQGQRKGNIFNEILLTCENESWFVCVKKDNTFMQIYKNKWKNHVRQKYLFQMLENPMNKKNSWLNNFRAIWTTIKKCCYNYIQFFLLVGWKGACQLQFSSVQCMLLNATKYILPLMISHTKLCEELFVNNNIVIMVYTLKCVFSIYCCEKLIFNQEGVELQKKTEWILAYSIWKKFNHISEQKKPTINSFL